MYAYLLFAAVYCSVLKVKLIVLCISVYIEILIDI